ncbi:hypothetical protein DICPUDRAFT_150695 [Dictyostelium purpureum]|uniref:Uncharacterized protein n=1 Tax=Dictyostelium purpureum TaxID=5786 RepID=F0ZH06_DICPU|nr:uncharacterized protein DICPUDRAFT_150695 [Dictyostelium purpureum]EGC36750.1 hypothetical protein DICPUDRAFT_150695 [Dictyostelium purpureum]|eukprot:XP_003286696.1 hypothetical protein DICPUDRAFT_150695 [Dictyostelium purpureum]
MDFLGSKSKIQQGSKRNAGNGTPLGTTSLSTTNNSTFGNTTDSVAKVTWCS